MPKTATSGVYNGNLKIIKDGAEIENLAIKLTVLDLEFPDRPSFVLDLLSYDLPEKMTIISSKGVPLTEIKATEPAKTINHQIYRLTMDNRCFLNVLPYNSQRGYPTQAYPVSGQGASATIPSFAEFDDFFGQILDGKLNKYGKAPAHFTMAFNVNYPHICDSDREKQFDWTPFANKTPQGPGEEPALKEYEDTNKAITTLTLRHFAEKGWKDTTFEFFHNQKGDDVVADTRKGSRNRVGRWKLDEPVTKNDYEALRYLLNVNRWSAESAKSLGIKTANRLDIGHWHCDKLLDINGNILKDYKAKEYDSANAKDILASVVDHWVIGVAHMDGAFQYLKDYEKPGVKIMTYSSMGVLELNNCGIRGEGFKASRRGTIGNIIDISKLIDPNSKPMDDRYVFYSGKSVDFKGALCPKRLKLWRDAVNDFEYVIIAKAKNPLETKAIVEKVTFIVPAGGKSTKTMSLAHSNNPEDYLSARLLLAEIATGKKIEGVSIQGYSKDFSNATVGDQVVGFD